MSESERERERERERESGNIRPREDCGSGGGCRSSVCSGYKLSEEMRARERERERERQRE